MMLTRDEIILRAAKIAVEYAAEDMRLTIRQIYYQFVSRWPAEAPSGQRFYKRIVAALADARLAGLFPFKLIEDRGRDSGKHHTWERLDVDGALENAEEEVRRLPRWVDAGTWFGQDIVPSVWVEKEALAGILEPLCNDLGVPMFACKGYPSLTALWEWINDSAAAFAPREVTIGDRVEIFEAQRSVILYLGDHDPDGLEIPRSSKRRLEQIMALDDEPSFPVEMRRIALTMEQIEEYKPPPFWAKLTSSRYQKYVDETGTDEAWELDALDPRRLRELVRSHVLALYSSARRAEVKELIAEGRDLFLDEADGAVNEWLREGL
jgi:hypothetical protein